MALRAVTLNDAAAARVVIGMKRRIQEQVASAEYHDARRPVADAPNRELVHSVKEELIEKLNCVYYFVRRMARTLDQENASEVSVAAQGEWCNQCCKSRFRLRALEE
ncbi:MAG TPA: hypothetical protein PLZ16_04015 [Gammaproteobacteria bacterium]|nr:hypothetical protein [Gammaproteobacteria bacterium]